MVSSVDVKPVCVGRVVGLSLGKFAYVGGVLGLLALCAPALAGPEGENVVAGSAQFSHQGDLTVIQAANNTIIDYASFNIAQHETVQFVQPGATSRVLNRVYGALPTHIDGTLTANGMVYFANPAGIYFGGQAIVNVGGLVAAAGTITNTDFLSGVDHFSNLTGTVENLGTIQAQTAHLVGRHVVNRGTVISPGGMVTMTAGEDVYLGKRDGHLFVRIDGAAIAGPDAAGVENTGKIAATGGHAVMMAGDMAGLAIKQTGTVKAADVRLEGTGTGEVRVSGTLDASDNFFGTGGRVTVTGERVSLDDAAIDASGTFGGGDVRIGGDYQGGGDLRRSKLTFVSSDSTINADATVSGDGGRVILWSDGATAFGGQISARGGAAGGNGGFAEVSGKKYLVYQGKADLRAPKGSWGELLLDPTNIIVDDANIETTDLADVDAFTDPDISGNGSNNTILDVDSINNAAAMANVTLQATNDITFDAPISTINDNVSLTAVAGNDIVVNQSITLRGGSISFTANSSATAGQTGSGSIDINAAMSTAGGGITGGAITLFVDGGTGSIDLGGNLSTAGGVVTLDNDAIALTANVAIDTDPAAGATDAADIIFAGNSTTTGAFTLGLDASADGSAAAGDVNLGAVEGATGLTVAGGNLAARGDLDIDGAIDLRSGLASITLFDNEQSGEAGTGTQIDSTGGSDSAILLANTSGDFDLDVIGDAASAITLGSVDVNALDVTGGAVGLNGNVTADTSIDFSSAGAIALGGNRTITADNGGTPGSITFGANNVITGANSLTIDGGAVVLHQVGDGATDPTSLSVTATTLTLNDDLTVDGPVDLRTNVGAITLAADVTIDNTGGTNNPISLASASGDFDLGLTGDSTSALTLGATDVNGLAMTGGALSLNGNVTSDTALSFTNVGAIGYTGATTITAADSDAGNAAQNITFDSGNAITGTSALALDGDAIALFNVGNGAADPASLTVTSDGTLTVGGDLTVDGPVDLRTNVAALALSGNRTINTSGAAAGAGAILLRGVTSNTTLTLTAQAASPITLGGTDVDTLNLTGGALTLLANVTADTALDFTNVSNIVLGGGAVTITARDSDGGNAAQTITFDAANVITGAKDLALDGSTIALFQVGNGTSDPTSLSVTASNLTLNGNVTVDGAADLRTNVTALNLSGNRTINTSGAGAGAGDILLRGLTSNTALTLNAEDASTITLGATDVDSLTLQGGGTLDLLGNLTSDSALDFSNVPAVTLSGPVTITARDSDAGNAAQDITFGSGGTVTGAQALVLDGDTVTLMEIGGGGADPTSLSVTAETGLVLNGDITVDGAVDLRTNVAAITVAGDTAIDTTGGTNAAIALADATGDFNLGLAGDSGSALTLGATDVNGLALTGGAVSLNGSLASDTALDFSNAGAISYTGATTIAAGDGGTAQDITFDAANTITGDGALTLNGDAVTLFQIGNGAADPTSLDVTAAVLDLNGSITVDGPADLRTNVGAITLGANSSVDTSGGTNAAIMLADATGDFDLALTGDGGAGGSAITLGATDVNSLAMTGGALSLNGDVTSDGALDFTNVDAIAYAGATTITARDGATSADITTDAANVFTGTGALAFDGDNVTLNQVGSGGTNPSSVDIAADGAVTLAGTITSDGDITLRPGTAGTSIALHDGTGTFSVSAASLGQLATTGTVIIGDAASGAINVAGSGFIDLSAAGFDLTLRGASVTFNTAANDGIQLAADKTLAIETATGGVLTNGGTNSDVIITGVDGSLVIDASGAIGNAPDAISTEVGRLAATTSAGGVFVANAGGLTISNLNGVDGVTAGSNGDISITAASPLTVDAPVTATGAGGITLHAMGGDTGDLTVNAAVTSDTGDISLLADNNAVFAAGGDVTSSSGAITATADADMANSGGAGTGGALTMADGTAFTTGGAIAASSDGDLALGSLSATGGGADVDVTSVSGDILDANDDTAGNNVTHAAGAGTTTLTASLGAVGGGGNGLELELNGSNLEVNAQDGLALAVAGDLSGAFTISNGFLNLTADGTITTTGAWLADTISVSAGDVSIGHTITGGTSVAIDLDAPGTIGVGNATGDLTIDGAELELITTPSLTIGGANTTAMTVDGVTGAQSNNAALVTLAAAGDVTFNGTASVFNALAVEADDGATVEVNLTTDTGALSLDGDANDAADAFDGLNVSPSVTLTSAGNLTTAATTGGVSLGDAVALNSSSAVFLEDATVAQGALTVDAFNGVTVSGALTAINGATSIDADSNANGFGTLTVAGTGSIGATGQALTLKAADMDLLGDVTTTGGTLSIMRASAGSIGLGDASGDLRLDNTDLSNIIAGDATISGASVTALTADAAAAPNIMGTLTLDATGGAATFENGASTFGGGLDVMATSVTFDAGVTTAGALTAASDQDLSIGGVALASGGAMNLSSVGGDIVLTGADGSTATLDVNADTDLTLGTVTTSGANNPNLAIESDGGVTLSGVTLGTGFLNVTVDANNDGAATASLAAITAGGVAATGGAGDTLTLGGPVSTSTAAGVALTGETVNINDDVGTAGGGGLGVTNSGTLTVANGVALTLDGAFGQAGAGPVSWGGLLITTDDNVFFTGPMTLTTNSTVNTGTGGGDVNFGGSINGDFSLDVDAGTGLVSFAAPVGDVTPLSGLNVNSSGGLTFAGDVAADDEGITLASSGPVTLNRAFTTTNGGGFTINNTGTVTIDPAAVFALTGDFLQSGTGPVILNGDFGAAGRRSTFMGAVTLTSDATFTGSEFTFGGTVDSDAAATPRAVAFDTTGFTEITGTMGGTNPLRTFTSSTAGTTRLGGTVTTTSGSVFSNPVVLSGDAVVSDTGADSPGVFFNSTIDGDGGGARNLTVLVNNQNAPDDGDLPVIRFGANVGASQALGSLLLNFSQAAGFVPRANVPLVATITAQPLDANGDPIPLAMLPAFGISFNTTGDFRMGQNEKFTTLGDLTISSSAGTVRVGDLTTLGNLTINAPTIRVLSRQGSRLVARDGSSAQEDADAGTDLVAGGTMTFSTAPDVEGGGVVRLTTPTGGGISTVPGGFVALAFDGEFVPQLFVLQSDQTRVLDLRAEGVSTQNIAQAIAGAVPRETRANDVGQNTTVSQGQLERLEQIGIYPRDLSPRELVEFLSGRALYYDYPRKAEPSAADYQVTKRRLSAERITALLAMYDEVFREPAIDPATGRQEVDEQGQPVLMDRSQEISQSLADAASAYRSQTGAGRIDPIALRAFIEASPEYAELAADLDNIGRFLDALDQVGLSRRETVNARLAILQKLAPPSLGVGATGAATLEEMIRGERAAEVQ